MGKQTYEKPRFVALLMLYPDNMRSYAQPRHATFRKHTCAHILTSYHEYTCFHARASTYVHSTAIFLYFYFH